MKAVPTMIDYRASTPPPRGLLLAFGKLYLSFQGKVIRLVWRIVTGDELKLASAWCQKSFRWNHTEDLIPLQNPCDPERLFTLLSSPPSASLWAPTSPSIAHNDLLDLSQFSPQHKTHPKKDHLLRDQAKEQIKQTVQLKSKWCMGGFGKISHRLYQTNLLADWSQVYLKQMPYNYWDERSLQC